jgi:hypothetical protein
MQYEVYVSEGVRRDHLAVFGSEKEAVDYVKSIGVIAFEADPDHEGCYDAFDKHCRVICIEPCDPIDDFNYVGSRHHY